MADSQKERTEANLNTMDDLEHNLSSYGLDAGRIPLVLQFNKRDLPGIMPVEQMSRDLNRHGWPTVESVALGGSGPTETLKEIARVMARRHGALV